MVHISGQPHSNCPSLFQFPHPNPLGHISFISTLSSFLLCCYFTFISVWLPTWTPFTGHSQPGVHLHTELECQSKGQEAKAILLRGLSQAVKEIRDWQSQQSPHLQDPNVTMAKTHGPTFWYNSNRGTRLSWISLIRAMLDLLLTHVEAHPVIHT